MSDMIKLPPRTGQIIYGPIHSRRIGVDIGINLLVQEGKTCNFNCVYCQYGVTGNPVDYNKGENDWIKPVYVYDAVEKALSTLSRQWYKLDAVTFSGYGEPTLHPKFTQIVERVKKIKEKYYPNAKLTLITNSSTLKYKRIMKIMELFDQILAKLDAGTDKTFHLINRPINKKLKISSIIDNLTILSSKVKHLIIQTLLFNTEDERITPNTSLEEMSAISQAICKINPKEVQVYTIVRAPAISSVKPATVSQLQQLKKYIDERCGSNVNVKIY
ncbi:MAG: radical SAM protein [Candidatus Odinarchaeum yellowstonii]|uniref:Radical SAM protein n=1 Tax=Odinarchaeota yellowstonii (strain LCB_4) TaxID=1841599 RepID=A0AAF0IBR5_ODILC|nr:MAG: radical SAM protein [Candidatus Odinarchaeum yellowstonii]